MSIIGLAGLYPSLLLAIAGLALAGAFLFEGGAIAGRYARIVALLGGSAETLTAAGGGMSVEFLAGVGGAILGILSLLNIVPLVLMPVSVLLFGCALAIGAGAADRVRVLATPESERVNAPLHELESLAMGGATGVRLLLGLGAIVLGILALVGVGNPTTICLAALLGLGTAITLSGTAMGAALLGIFQHK
ncbi:MAG: hypothetical protein LLG01_04610 [Planctomycetaceae bacterium]|nr:hypothetical protein [Planctomycetaceae bacterium]